MSLAIAFWVLYIIAIVFGGFIAFRPADPRFTGGSNLLYFVLLGLLAWQVFGAAVHR